MKTKNFIEACKLDRQLVRLNIDITRLEELSAEQFSAYYPANNIPTEISEPFRIACLESMRKQKEVLTERFGML